MILFALLALAGALLAMCLLVLRQERDIKGFRDVIVEIRAELSQTRLTGANFPFWAEQNIQSLMNRIVKIETSIIAQENVITTNNQCNSEAHKGFYEHFAALENQIAAIRALPPLAIHEAGEALAELEDEKASLEATIQSALVRFEKIKRQNEYYPQ